MMAADRHTVIRAGFGLFEFRCRVRFDLIIVQEVGTSEGYEVFEREIAGPQDIGCVAQPGIGISGSPCNLRQTRCANERGQENPESTLESGAHQSSRA